MHNTATHQAPTEGLEREEKEIQFKKNPQPASQTKQCAFKH